MPKTPHLGGVWGSLVVTCLTQLKWLLSIWRIKCLVLPLKRSSREAAFPPLVSAMSLCLWLTRALSCRWCNWTSKSTLSSLFTTADWYNCTKPSISLLLHYPLTCKQDLKILELLHLEGEPFWLRTTALDLEVQILIATTPVQAGSESLMKLAEPYHPQKAEMKSRDH